MSNEVDLAPKGESGVTLLTSPLNKDLMPEPTDPPKFDLAPKGESGVEILGFSPISTTADLSMFSQDEARQRDIYRDYGVNIREGVNLESTAGQLQSKGSKWGNGIVKMAGTAVTTFLEPFVDMTYGIATGAITGKFSGVYDNAITNAFDNFGEYLRTEYPNFYTQAEKDMGFAQSLGTANFWSDQGLQGVGFLAGAIASGYVAGASNLVGMSYRGISMGRLKAWRNVVNNFRKSNLGSKATQISKTRDIIGSINTNALNANMYGAGLFSALGEAGIEARESKRRATEIMTELRATGDPRYVNMSDEEIDALSDTAANTAYGLNALIVGGSNVLQFGKAFSRGWNPTSKKYLKGLVTQEAPLKYKFTGLPKEWKRAAQTAAWFKRPSVEAFEEWSQASINVAVEDYFKDVYSANPWSDTADYIEGGIGVMSTLMRGYMESPKTKEGQQAIFLGALLGKLGEAGSALRGGETSRKEWLETYERTKDLTARLNNLDANGTLSKLLQAHAQIQKAQEKMDIALRDGDVFSYKNQEQSAMFALIDTYIEAERIEDLEAFIDSIAELSNEEFKESMGIPQDIEVKDVAEQVKDIRDKIEFIKQEKPKIDKFLMSASKMDDLQKFIAGGAIRKYGYMADTLDKRRQKLSAEISKLSNGNINFETLKNLDLASEEVKSALAEMQDNANKDKDVTQINLNSLAPLLADIGSVEYLRQEYVKLMNKMVEEELKPAVLKGADKKEEKIKSDSEIEAEEIKAEILQEEDEALSEDRENIIAQEATETIEEPTTLAEEVKDTLTITEKEQSQIQRELERSTKDKFKTLSKQLGIPLTDDVISLLDTQDTEIERLISLEERGVDIEATEETPIGVLLSYPNASINSRFMGQEGIVYKDSETGETIFESQSGQEFVLGQNVNENTLSELGIEALEDQTYISLVADGRTFEIGGQYYNNLFINPLSAIDPFIFRQDNPGFVPRRVTLFDSEGKKVTFVNPFIVQEVSRLIALMEVVKKEAQLELLQFKGDQVFEFEGVKYYIEDTVTSPYTVDGRYTTAAERNAGIPTAIVYNEKLNKLRSPSKIAQVLKARDAHIENYVQEKINKFKEEYNEDILGKRTDGDIAVRTEEEVKQNAAESTGEPASAESIGTEQTAPNKTEAQANSKVKPEEVERSTEVGLNVEEEESDESPFYENTTSTTGEDPVATIIAEETSLDDDTASTRESIVNASDLNIEVASNEDVDISNEAANTKDSDIIDDIQPLKTILSLAWKSLNHPKQSGENNSYNKRLTNLLEGDPTTEFGKLKPNGTLKGVDIIFTIDLKDPNLTKLEKMQAIASKVKYKKPLSPKELGELPIKAVLQVPNTDSETGVSQFQTYVHRNDYIDKHIKLDEQDTAREMLAELRATVYNNYVNGIESKSFVTEMTGGHLNNTSKGAKNNVTTVLNVGRKGNPVLPKFVFARNGNYINEFGEVDKDFKFLSVKPKLDEDGKVISNNDGAVYVKIPMNNGEIFPLRVFVSDLNKNLAELIWQMYLDVTRGRNLNSEINRYNLFKESKEEIYKDLAGILDTVKEGEAPTYNQLLDLLVFKGKKTINSKAPTLHFSNGKVTLGDKVYTKDEWFKNKTEIVEYLMANKRTHVNAKYMNSKTQDAYNLFLTKHDLVFTNAFTNSSTRSAFVQPTLRFAAIGAPKESRTPLPGPSPVVKPEAPVAKKESVKSNKLTSQQEKEFTDLNLLFAKLYEGRPLSGPVLIRDSNIVFSFLEIIDGKLFKNFGKDELTNIEVDAYFKLIKAATPIFEEVKAVIETITPGADTYNFWQKVTELIQKESLEKTGKRIVGQELINAVNQKIQSLEGTKRAKDILVETVRERRESGQGATKYDRRFMFYRPITNLLSQSVDISAEELSEDKFPTTTKYIMQELAVEKESPRPNQIMPITEIEDYLKDNLLPKLINRDFEFIGRQIEVLATVPKEFLGSTSAVIGNLGPYPAKKMFFNDIIKAIYNLENESTAEQIELAALKFLKEEELYVDPKGEIRSLEDDTQFSTLIEKESPRPDQVTDIDLEAGTIDGKPLPKTRSAEELSELFTPITADPKTGKTTPRVEPSTAPGPGGMTSLTMADLPADMQAEAAEALAKFEAAERGDTTVITDLNKDKELIEAGLGAIVPKSSKIANILKTGTVITGKELEELLNETSKQGKVELNLEQENKTAPSDNTLDWGDNADWMLDPTNGMDTDALDNAEQDLNCD